MELILNRKRTSSYKSFSKAGGKTDSLKQGFREQKNRKLIKAIADGLISFNAKSFTVLLCASYINPQQFDRTRKE